MKEESHPHRETMNRFTVTELYLFHVQRTDGRGVSDARFTNHCLGKLHLRRDVGHLHRIVVVVGDIESVLEERQHWKSSLETKTSHKNTEFTQR